MSQNDRVKARRKQKKPLSKAYANFIDSMQSPATKDMYDRRLRLFLEAIKERNYDKLVQVKPLELQDKIIAFVKELRNRGFSYSTAHGYVSAIRHFCVMNDMVLNWPKIAKFAGENTKVAEDRLYSREEIQRILDKCDERKRVMILLLMTGMRVGALHELKLKHLAETSEKGICKLTVYPGTTSRYSTFTTPECSRAIDSYLDYRKRKGETLTPESPLIREQFCKEDADSPRHLTMKGLVGTLEPLLYNAGLRTKTNSRKRKEVMRFHAFRKYVNTAMIKANVKPVVKEMLLGHRVGLEDSYYRPSEDEMLAEFLKAVDLLTISHEKALTIENEKLKAEVTDIEGIKKNYIDLKITSESTIADLQSKVQWLMEAQLEKRELDRHQAELERKIIEET